MTDPTPRLRGFAALDPERRREMASKGGKACNPANRSFSRDANLAAAAGRKGGLVKSGARHS